MYNFSSNVLGEQVTDTFKPKKGVFLEGANFNPHSAIKKVAPAPTAPPAPVKAFQAHQSIVADSLKPMMMLLRAIGMFPVTSTENGVYATTPALMIYSIVICLFMFAYIGYLKWDTIEIVKSAEGRFEETVISYLFTVYLIPIVINPLLWYESRKLGRIFSDWVIFERIYEKIERRQLPLFVGNKPLIITLALPVISCGTMIITHLTMVYFRFIQVVPYCYINTVTFLVGGFWYLHCDLIGKVATIVAEDFQTALKNIGPAVRVSEFRSLWMLLARITRDVGLGSSYVMTFLSLYLFLIITLTIYGLLSTLQEGFSIKDIGLLINATFSIALLYFICDEAHYASNCVRVNFQKKLLLVELSWMNDDAQQEINMFLRATEMNPTDISLGGFFDVNRNLFKSLLATMVTYLVVLLQFQISIPEDLDSNLPNITMSQIATNPSQPK